MSRDKAQAEQKRIEILKLYDVLDTLPEQEFDDITRLASEICHTPIALISIIDEKRQWFKSKFGLGLDASETDRNLSFCTYAIESDTVLEVEDATTDDRFSKNPFVTSFPHVRYYAGAPLITKDGYNLGTLCVLDSAPHKLSDNQKRSLQILARSVMFILELRHQKKEADFFRKALDEVAAVAVVDNKNNFEYVNEKFSALIEMTPAEVIGKNGKDVTLADINEQQRAEIMAKVHANQTYHTEIKNVHKNGDVSWSDLHVIPYANNSNEIVKIFSLRIDITAKVQMLNRFEEAEKLSDIGIWEVNLLNGNRYWSKGLFSLMGFKAHALPETMPTVLDFVAPEDKDKLSASIDAVLKGKDNEMLNEVKVITADGKEKIFSVTTNRTMNAKGEVIYLSGTLQDITARKKTEEAIREAARLAMEAREMQQNFLSRMSHEIRTPMNGVVGLVNLLSNTPLTSKQKTYADGISQSAVNMLRIINDILDISKIEAGKIVFEETQFDLLKLVDNVLLTIKTPADEKGIIVASHVDHKIPAMLVADPVRLNQVLLNLAGNALKFTEKGSVIISVSQLVANNNNLTLEFKVSDTGIGIAKDKLDHIFDSFTQAESDTTRKYGGTGLGLTIAKQLIEQQNGTIKVESEPGRGTTFSFTYNCKVKEDAEDNKVSENTSAAFDQLSLTGINILLVEDNVINQMVAQHTLEYWDANVTIAERGAIAIDLLKKHSFDIVLMDIQMPEMSGVEATKIIRGMGITTPVIAMTASAMKGERDNCIAAGMNDYFSKPFDPQDLNKIIHKYLLENGISNTEKLINIPNLLKIVDNNSKIARSILQVFIDNTPGKLIEMIQHRNDRDFDALFTDVHNLKNTIGILGKASLNELLTEIETDINGRGLTETTVNNLKTIEQSLAQLVKEAAHEMKLL